MSSVVTSAHNNNPSPFNPLPHRLTPLTSTASQQPQQATSGSMFYHHHQRRGGINRTPCLIDMADSLEPFQPLEPEDEWEPLRPNFAYPPPGADAEAASSTGGSLFVSRDFRADNVRGNHGTVVWNEKAEVPKNYALCDVIIWHKKSVCDLSRP